jgi:hypothetical protein
MRENFAQVEITKHPVWWLFIWKTLYPIREVRGHGGCCYDTNSHSRAKHFAETDQAVDPVKYELHQ